MLEEKCVICGTINKEWIFKEVLTKDLSLSWELNDDQIKRINQRETSGCSFCGNSARTRALAKAVMKELNFGNDIIFDDWIEEANKRNYEVAEINSCGRLHAHLVKIPNLQFSEYHSDDNADIGDIPNENILNLSYRDNSFDLVLHSETLEHVADYKKALSECTRILKPGGVCIYTVPIINGRNTKKCIEIDKEGALFYLKPPSYHGLSDDFLVFWEFGDDFPELSKSILIYSEPETLNYVFAVRKNQGE